jgi:hypothetical protein
MASRLKLARGSREESRAELRSLASPRAGERLRADRPDERSESRFLGLAFSEVFFSGDAPGHCADGRDRVAAFCSAFLALVSLLLKKPAVMERLTGFFLTGGRAGFVFAPRGTPQF